MKKVKSKTYSKLLQTAWDYYEKNEKDRARQVCSKIISEYEPEYHSYYLLGCIELDAENHKAALDNLNEALKNDTNKSDHGWIHYLIGKTYADVPFLIDNPFYDKTNARRHLNIARSYDKCPAEVYLQILSCCDDIYDEIKALEEAILKFPAEARFYYFLSVRYEKLAKKKEQYDALLKGSKIVASCALNFHIAQLFLDDGEYEKAKDYFQIALNNSSDSDLNNLFYYKIGRCLILQGKEDKGLEMYGKMHLKDAAGTFLWSSFFTFLQHYKSQNRLQEIDSLITEIPITSECYSNINSEYYFFFERFSDYHLHIFEDGDFEELLLTMYSQAQLTPQIKTALGLICYEICLDKDDDDAIKYIFDIVSQFTHKMHYHFVIETLLWRITSYLSDENKTQKQLDVLVERFLKLIRTNEFLKWFFLYKNKELHAEYLEKIIKSLYKLKRYKGIIEYFELQSFKANSDLLFEIAYSYSETGNKEKALQYYTDYIKDHTSSAALNNIGVIYKEKGDLLQAISFFRKALDMEKDNELYRRNFNSAIELSEKQQYSLREKQIPEKWLSISQKVNVEYLNDIGYFNTIDLIQKKVKNQKFQSLILRDYNELVSNSILSNFKGIIVLSGSFVELLLTYFYEKKKIKIITVDNNKGNLKNKKLYECNLIDLIDYANGKNYFRNDFHHLSNLARVYRNYIHPGLELEEPITKMKADICFISTNEIIKKILR